MAPIKKTPAGRVTQRDVAERAGVHRSTVSLALRDNPNIPAETTERVKQAAAELGYEPDPMLTALAAYRSGRRDKPFRGTLAWLVNNNPMHDWRAVTMIRDIYLGAKERAPVHGYSLEIFKLGVNGLPGTRVAGVLRSRNVSGILVCPQPRPNTALDFPWGNFSSVAFGHTLVSPQLHTVVSAHFRSMMHLLNETRALGYRRIGLVHSRNVDMRVSHAYLGAYLANSHLYGAGVSVPPVDPAEDDFKRWFRRCRPDAVVSAGLADITAVLEGAGLSAPRDVGVAVLPLPEASGEMAGMYENSRHMGAIAIDLLVSLMQQGLRGAPEFPHYTHVDSVWVPGASLPPRTSA